MTHTANPARRLFTKHPFISTLLIQAAFWVGANMLLVVLNYLHSELLQAQYGNVPTAPLSTSLLVAVGAGLLYGLAQGIAIYYFNTRLFRRKPLGQIFLFRTLFSLLVLWGLFAVLRYGIAPLLLPNTLAIEDYSLSNANWRLVFGQLLLYYTFMTVVISFVEEMRKKFGPGLLLPIILGKYRNPREEVRIFLFMDLKSSTAIAESLGHLEYSAFIRDAFLDINQLIAPYQAEIYQYVGDEIVLTWSPREGLLRNNAIRFYFACNALFRKRNDYYQKHYGQLPNFKAGLHMGVVTAVQIGQVKVDIAYHGDTINVASRIQSCCNQYDKQLLVSEELLLHSSAAGSYHTEALGAIDLKGKKAPVRIASVEEK